MSVSCADGLQHLDCFVDDLRTDTVPLDNCDMIFHMITPARGRFAGSLFTVCPRALSFLCQLIRVGVPRQSKVPAYPAFYISTLMSCGV